MTFLVFTFHLLYRYPNQFIYQCNLRLHPFTIRQQPDYGATSIVYRRLIQGHSFYVFSEKTRRIETTNFARCRKCANHSAVIMSHWSIRHAWKQTRRLTLEFYVTNNYIEHITEKVLGSTYGPIPVEADLKPANIGLFSAWHRAQDRTVWSGLIRTAMPQSGVRS